MNTSKNKKELKDLLKLETYSDGIGQILFFLVYLIIFLVVAGKTFVWCAQYNVWDLGEHISVFTTFTIKFK